MVAGAGSYGEGKDIPEPPPEATASGFLFCESRETKVYARKTPKNKLKRALKVAGRERKLAARPSRRRAPELPFFGVAGSAED